MSKAKALMFQATSSFSGKSTLCAALGRMLAQDGISVAPFKSQNMALNSYVTPEGAELGRSQALQAQACRINPRSDMNPILLKPSKGMGCQVVAMGKPIGHIDSDGYREWLDASGKRVIQEAYARLASEFDVLLIEGAGSPAEPNLKQHDVANMWTAAMAEAPVLIVADIDRGGAFASLVGTHALLDPEEQACIKGFVLNKFRGDVGRLQPALDIVQERTGVPFIGVVPFMHDLALPEEDAVAIDDRNHRSAKAELSIGVVALPHLSNFTDFQPFEHEPEVALRWLRQADEVGSQDAVLVPGSKSTANDLNWLRATGFSDALCQAAHQGKVIVGLCGGYQMLGERILDADSVESSTRELRGLGLLSIVSSFAADKLTRQVRAKHLPSGLEVDGYEIHHGRSESNGPPLFQVEGGVDGAVNETGNVWGAYLHGIFEDDAFRRWFLDELRTRKGLQPRCEIQSRYDVNAQLDALAATVRESLDLQRVYQLLDLKS